MNTVIIILAAFIGMFRFNAHGRVVVLLFTLPTLTFNYVDTFIPDRLGMYSYIGAALVDFSIVVMLSLLSRPSKLVLSIQRINIAFIVVSIVGLIMYENSITPQYYSILCTILYLGFLSVASGGDSNVMGIDNRNDWSFGSTGKSDYALSTHKAENGT